MVKLIFKSEEDNEVIATVFSKHIPNIKDRVYFEVNGTEICCSYIVRSIYRHYVQYPTYDCSNEGMDYVLVKVTEEL